MIVSSLNLHTEAVGNFDPLSSWPWIIFIHCQVGRGSFLYTVRLAVDNFAINDFSRILDLLHISYHDVDG